MLINVGEDIGINNVPMYETSYYKWLSKGNATHIGMNDRRRWLVEEHNFIYGEDTVSEPQLTALSYIHDYWFLVNRKRS